MAVLIAMAIQGLYTKYADVVEQLSGSKERM